MALRTSVKRKLHYGWVIFGLTFANLTVEGGAKNSQSVFLLALRNHFGSSLTLTSAIFSVAEGQPEDYGWVIFGLTFANLTVEELTQQAVQFLDRLLG